MTRCDRSSRAKIGRVRDLLDQQERSAAIVLAYGDPSRRGKPGCRELLRECRVLAPHRDTQPNPARQFRNRSRRVTRCCRFR